MSKIQQIKHRQALAYWKQVILAPQQSGLNATEYCRQQDMNFDFLIFIHIDCCTKGNSFILFSESVRLNANGC